jgi:cytochrome c-type biogenesis protein CcmH/NrfG
MSPLGKRIIVLTMLWVFLVMIFTQIYDNVTGKNMPVRQSMNATAEPTPVGPDPAIQLLADLQACVASDPQNLECTLELADLYFINRQWPQAQINYESAVKLDASNLLAWRRLAATVIYQDRFNEAVPILEKAAQLDARSAEIQLLLGLALSRVEPPRNAEAIAAWQRVLQIAPDSEWARQAASYIAELQR